MKHFILLILFGFFIVINADVKVEEKQTLNEYKIEQQQKSIDELKAEIKELKKEIDDTKEKKIGNEKDNESLDKRIGDINGSVDRFGIIAGILGLLITIGLAISGWLGYTKAKTESKEVAKEESEKVTKDWINNEANKQLNEMITKLEDDAKEKIAEAVQNAKDELKQQSKAEELLMQGNSHYYNKEYSKAEEYYKKAIDGGNNDALNNIAYLYFSQSENKEKSLEFVNKSYEIKKGYANTHTLATILLWNENFDKSYEKFEECIEYEEAFESLDDMSEYLNLLISKGQHHKVKEYLENEKYQLKDKLKPIWYALMTLMQDEFPNEIKKMGSELQTSVDDILKTIEELKQKYKI